MFPDLWKEDQYLQSLQKIIQRCIPENQHSQNILAHILSDQQLNFIAADNFRLLLPLGLAGWWLLVQKGQNEGREIAWQLTSQLKEHFVYLSSVLQSSLEQAKTARLSPEQVKQLQVDFQRVLETVKQEARLRPYQGVPLAIHIQRFNLKNIIEPLYDTLEGASVIAPEIKENIERLSINELLDNNPLQREDMHPIIGAKYQQMVNVYQKVIDLLQEALALREQIDRGTLLKNSGPITSWDERVKQDIQELQYTYPEACWAIEQFLPGNLFESGERGN